MTKAVLAIALAALALALAGCAGIPSGGRNLNGFPLDPSCAAYYGADPLYGGNLALAYATNCVGSTM
jgi:hypothetical protein